MRLATLVIILTFAKHVCCFAFDDAPTPKELVQRLVSPNRPINPKGKLFVEATKDYDVEAQKTVEHASDELLKLGFRAIPDLIAGLDDKRYCRTEVYSRAVDFSVGNECYRLLERITTPAARPDYDALPKSQFKRVKGYPSRIGADGKWHNVSQSYLDLLIYSDSKSEPKQNSMSKWWAGFADNVAETMDDFAECRVIANIPLCAAIVETIEAFSSAVIEFVQALPVVAQSKHVIVD